MIALKKPKLKHFSALMELNVQPEQQGYVETFEYLYEHRSNEDVIYSITLDGKMIGFFALDLGFSKKYTFAGRQEVELKNLFIDQHFQNKGYGKAALERLALYMYTAYPDVSSVCVLAEKDNQAVIKCCQNAGFEDAKQSFYDNDGKRFIVLRKANSTP
ncbi:GNAT family N-acetyltransferase [Vibrio sp. SCSIO 43136]|uniref:GNAT family N-acetyltransferase n=1 Tax=Vibrio sp. SCSIO 43136 TaxID=2819101 RepID=UPI002074B87A|nr:GNAT family N-acetyltransferase [Vibrio sp. SCSIO 43136]USD66433.1 GNAT family N-acetyltransferase [Vibrio sp. SCSIO 43136]